MQRLTCVPLHNWRDATRRAYHHERAVPVYEYNVQRQHQKPPFAVHRCSAITADIYLRNTPFHTVASFARVSPVNEWLHHVKTDRAVHRRDAPACPRTPLCPVPVTAVARSKVFVFESPRATPRRRAALCKTLLLQQRPLFVIQAMPA